MFSGLPAVELASVSGLFGCSLVAEADDFRFCFLAVHICTFQDFLPCLTEWGNLFYRRHHYF